VRCAYNDVVGQVIVAHEQKRRARKTSVLAARYEGGHDHDGPESPLGGCGQWSTCSSTPSHPIGSVLRGCRMGHSQKLNHCDAISF
jgi:hypothetical protein